MDMGPVRRIAQRALRAWRADGGNPGSAPRGLSSGTGTGAGPARTSGGVKSEPPPPPPSSGTPPAQTTRPGLADPTLLIPLLGLPALAGWYAYQVYVQQEHDNRIDAVHSAIKRSRGAASSLQPTPRQQELLQAPLPAPVALQPAQVTSEAPDGPKPKPQPATPEAEPATPPPSSASASPPAEPTLASVAPPGEPKTPVQEASAAGAATAAIAVHKALEPNPAPVEAPPPQTAAQHRSEAATAEAATAPPPPETDVAAQLPVPYPNARPIKKGEMGITVDVSPAGLVQHANAAGLGPGDDWAAYAHHHKQAVADARALGQALQEVAAWHTTELGAVQAERDAATQRVADVLEKAKAATESFKRLLRQHQEMAAELRALEVGQAEKRTALAAAQAAEAERTARIAALDEVRLQLNALAAAHEARITQQAASAVSHTLALSALAVEQALAVGAPLGPHLQALAERTHVLATAPPGQAGVRPEDLELVKVAVAAIPPASARVGVPTVDVLSERLRGLQPAVASLSLLPAPAPAVDSNEAPPQTSGGIVSHALASILAWFKVDERGAVRTLGPDEALQSGGPGTALAAADVYVSQGRVLEAARVLRQGTDGTAAAAVVEAWCRDATARAAADQTAKLLRAHATALAASVL